MKSDNTFAIIKLGGKQHLVQNGDVIEVNKLPEETAESFDISEVLLVQSGDKVSVGTPVVANATVSAKILEQTKGPKVVKQTFKAKARQRKKVGHRQSLTKIQITKISA